MNKLQPFNPFVFSKRVPSVIYEERMLNEEGGNAKWRSISSEHYKGMWELFAGTRAQKKYRKRLPTPFFNDIEIFRLFIPFGVPRIDWGAYDQSLLSHGFKEGGEQANRLPKALRHSFGTFEGECEELPHPFVMLKTN